MTRNFDNIQGFYKFIDEISLQLQKEGFKEEGQKIYSYIHEVAWTTSSELLGELSIIFKKLKNQNKLPVSLRKDIDISLKTIKAYWN